MNGDSQMSFKLDDNQYRIHRVDTRNLAIQKLSSDGWRSVSWHGNSVHSLANGLTELIARHHIPDSNDTLAQQIAWLKNAIEYYGQAILQALNGIDGAG